MSGVRPTPTSRDGNRETRIASGRHPAAPDPNRIETVGRGSFGSGSSARKRLVLADDDPKILDMVCGLLDVRYEIVGTAPDGQSLVDEVLRLSPDVAVADISMPRLSGIEATRAILGRDSVVKIVILSVYDDSAYVEAAFNAGAHGYVLKLAAENELIPAIETVTTNGSYLSVRLR